MYRITIHFYCAELIKTATSIKHHIAVWQSLLHFRKAFSATGYHAAISSSFCKRECTTAVNKNVAATELLKVLMVC